MTLAVQVGCPRAASTIKPWYSGACVLAMLWGLCSYLHLDCCESRESKQGVHAWMDGSTEPVAIGIELDEINPRQELVAEVLSGLSGP